MVRKINPIIQWWVTPKLPKQHIFISSDKRPKGFYKILRLYFRKWLVHPIKRRMAKYYLWVLQNLFQLKVVAITGSAGKTTTKELVASILGSVGKTKYSFANIDPVYNIPSTILKCTPETKFLVLEMGVEYPGEMDFYTWLAKPDVSIITNIFPTHTEFFNSVKGVAKEKVKILKPLKSKDIALLNSENAYTRNFEKKTKAKVKYFGKNSQVYARNVKETNDMNTIFDLIIGKDKINVHFPILGNQFLSNALCASAVGHYLGADLDQIKKGLENFERAPHRMNAVKLKSGSIIIDDSYNNNPEAAKQALKVIEKMSVKKDKIIVFGDMLELGSLSKKYHCKLGELIARSSIKVLIGVGEESKELINEAKRVNSRKKYIWVEKESKVDKYLFPLLTKSSLVLVKGSRSIGLDKLVARLSR